MLKISKVLTSSPGLGRGLVTGLLAHCIGLALVLGDSLVNLLDDIRTDGGSEDGRVGVGGLSGLAIGTQDRDGRTGCHFAQESACFGRRMSVLCDSSQLSHEVAVQNVVVGVLSRTDLGMSMAGWLSTGWLKRKFVNSKGGCAAKFEKFWFWWVCEFASWEHSAPCSPCAYGAGLVSFGLALQGHVCCPGVRYPCNLASLAGPPFIENVQDSLMASGLLCHMELSKNPITSKVGLMTVDIHNHVIMLL